MPALQRGAALALAYEKAKSSIHFALHKLEDLWHLEDALLSGATSLSEACNAMRSVNTTLGQIQQVLVHADQSNWDEAGSSVGVEEWTVALKGVALHTETIIVNFLIEVGRSISDPPDAVKRISATPVNLFSLHNLGIEMRKILSALDGINADAVMRSLNTGTAASSIPQQAHLDHHEYELGLVGYGEIQKSIIDKLLDQSSHQECLRVAITGPHGAGKTALAQNIYHSTEVKSHFEICFWIFYTSHIESSCPENVETNQVLRKMLAKADPDKYYSLDNNNETQVILRLSESLKKKRYLIVVENILHYNELKKAFPDEKNGSRVLIVTREISNYERVIFGLDPKIIYELKPLSEQDNLQLLLRKSHHESDFQSVILQKEIATCWGDIPMNLLLLGAHFQFKPSLLNDIQFLRSIDATAASGGIIVTLYSYLPSVLKRCFACIAAVFPINYIIPADSVIQLWFAEGIILKEDSKTMKDTAKSYLDELIQRGFMRAICVYYHNQTDQTTRIVILDPELHANFNKYTHWKNPLFVETTGTLSLSTTSTTTLLNPELLVEDACQSYSYYEDPNGETLNFSQVRRLAVHLPCQFNRASSFEEGKIMRAPKYPRLHSLFFFGSVAPLMVSQFNFLRVLAVYQARIQFSEEDRACWLDGLVNLRYLGFIVCWIEAGSLGQKLSRFRHLQTLDLSESLVSGLSEFIKRNTAMNVVGPVNEEYRRWWSPVPDMCQ